MSTTEAAIEEIEFKRSEAMTLPWRVGFRDRFQGHVDYFVICDWSERDGPTAIVECPTEEMAKYIVDAHNSAMAKTLTPDGLELLEQVEFAEGALLDYVASEDGLDIQAAWRILEACSALVVKHGRTSVLVESGKAPET